MNFTAAVTPNQNAGDCVRNQCDGAGGVQSTVDNSDLPAPPSQCVLALCAAGIAQFSPQSNGTPCNENGGTTCNGLGQCV